MLRPGMPVWYLCEWFWYASQNAQRRGESASSSRYDADRNEMKRTINLLKDDVSHLRVSVGYIQQTVQCWTPVITKPTEWKLCHCPVHVRQIQNSSTKNSSSCNKKHLGGKCLHLWPDDSQIIIVLIYSHTFKRVGNNFPVTIKVKF